MRKAEVHMHERVAGRLWQNEDGYHFSYSAAYLGNDRAEAVSVTLPLKDEPYHSPTLFPFFDGLIPEGWLLDISTNAWKLNPRDRMGLLLACCRDCIGAVSIHPINSIEEAL